MATGIGTFKAWRNAIIGTFLVLAGIAAAALTAYSSRDGDPRITSAAAIASLVIVGLIIILVLPPLARSAGAEFAQIDLPISVTAGGMIFVALMVVVGFAAFNTGNNLLFMVLALLVSTLFVSLVAAQVTLRNLVVSARFPDHIFAGEPAPVVVLLKNTKRISPSLSVLVEARGPVEDDERRRRRTFRKRALAYFSIVPHRAAAEQRVNQTFARRGHELITGFELSTRAPFGFFRHRRRLRARNVDIIILPKPEAVGDRLHLLPMNMGRLLSARRGASQDLLSLRDYQPEDDLRHIDWKATARTRRLTVKEFSAEDERRVNIWLDIRAITTPASQTELEPNQNLKDPIDAENRFEKAVVQCASLVAHFIEERAEVRLIVGREAGRIGVGKLHLYDCLKILALVMPQRDHVVADQADDELFAERGLYESIIPADGSFTIILTAVPPGSIPAELWRISHVFYI